MSKITLGIASMGGIAGVGTIVAYQVGLFSSKEEKESPTVRTSLVKEGYELAGNNDQFKVLFKEFKSDDGFMKEVSQHKKNGEDLSTNDDQGRDALKALCYFYFDSKDSLNLNKASKWCVLRIKDKALPESKSWREITTGDGDKEDWKPVFESLKGDMVNYGISGINESTNSETGYSVLKTWCSTNKELPINTKNQTIQDRVVSWCTK